MKLLAYFLFCVFLAVVFYAAISLIRLAFVHIKAYFIRRKLAKLSATEKKDD